jgi:hypothetical protein
MTDSPRGDRAPRPTRILAGPLALALLASGCSPDPAQSQGGGGTRSKVPEIAKRQKHMEDMLKKGESKEKSPAKSR